MQYRVKPGHKLVLNDGEALAGAVVDLPEDAAQQYADALDKLDQAAGAAEPQATTAGQ